MKKFALLACVAWLLAACGNESAEAMDQQAKEAEAAGNDLLDQINASLDSANADTAAGDPGAQVDGATH